MERLELSKQMSLGPKSSASTNFATSVKVTVKIRNFKICFYMLPEKSFKLNYYFSKLKM
jgi:hypothetical protein